MNYGNASPSEIELIGFSFGGIIYFNDSRFKSLSCREGTFSDLASFPNINSDELHLYNINFLRGANFYHLQCQTGDRETFRIIKNEFLNQNNRVEALKYLAREMDAYDDEISFWNRPGESILLIMNKISNNHGLDWGRGIVFTIVIGFIFYSLFIWSLRLNVYREDFWTNFAYFLYPAHPLDFMKDYLPGVWSPIIDLGGRIFISYGIYQIAQAFRKYGKG